MTHYAPKSTTFLDDIIDYPGRFTFSNQAQKRGLSEKCDLEIEWFIGFRGLDCKIFELEVSLLLQNVLSQQKSLIFKLKYLVIEPSKPYKLYDFQVVLFKVNPFSQISIHVKLPVKPMTSSRNMADFESFGAILGD